MANFMEQMYAEHSEEGKRIKAEKEKQIREENIKSLAADVCDAVRGQIRRGWDQHCFESYITLYVFDGNNIGFVKELNKKPVRTLTSRRDQTYVGYLKINDEYEAEMFIKAVKNTMAEDGVKNFRIRKERVEVESVDSDALLKLRKKEYDTYIFHIHAKW